MTNMPACRRSAAILSAGLLFAAALLLAGCAGSGTPGPTVATVATTGAASSTTTAPASSSTAPPATSPATAPPVSVLVSTTTPIRACASKATWVR
jgi:hypothetical protein